VQPSPKLTLEECGVGRRPQREPAAALAEAQKGEKDAKTPRHCVLREGLFHWCSFLLVYFKIATTSW
jgi:hypothetical protein